MRKILNTTGSYTFIFFTSLALSVCSNTTLANADKKAHQQGPKEWLNTTYVSQVMVLGSPHLRQMKGEFTKTDFEPLLERLASYNPDAIAVEHIYGPTVFSYENRQDYKEVIEHFASRAQTLAKVAQQTLGVSPSEAVSRTRFPLEKIDYSQQQREHIILTQLAGYHLHTALLQWLKLNEDFQADITLPETIQKELQALSNSFDESVVIAAELALKLGLPQLYAMDDHSDKDIYPELTNALGEALRSGKVKIDRARLENYKTQGGDLLNQKDLVGYYSSLNSTPAVKESIYQWQTILDGDIEDSHKLARLSLWEIRNMHMVANILRIVALNPGKKVLVIVGASHKAYIDDYLSRMSTVELVQPIDYLGTTKSK